jgi:hypothetical protein
MSNSPKIQAYLLDLSLSNECSYLLLVALININPNNIIYKLFSDSSFVELSNLIVEGDFYKITDDQRYFFRTFTAITNFGKF